MKGLSDRFTEDAATAQAPAPVDALARLQTPEGPEAESGGMSSRFAALRDRADILSGACAALAIALVLWPHIFPDVLRIPPAAETTAEMATLTVQPLLADGTWSVPDWYGLFNAYQLETTLRDISVRCAYGLPMDAEVEHYLHARLQPDTQVQIFLADPGKCPRS